MYFFTHFYDSFDKTKCHYNVHVQESEKQTHSTSTSPVAYTAVAAVCLSQEIYICQSDICWLLSILQSAFKLNPFYSHGVTEQWHFAYKFINHYKLGESNLWT